MTIDAYVGNPGSGKSHGVVQSVVIPALKAGRRVVHNMPLIEEEVRKLVETGELVEIDKSMKPAEFTQWFRDNHRGALLVLDEAWRLWPSGLKSSSIPETERSLFAEHRHLVGQTPDGQSTDIVLVSQNLPQIARFIVDLVDQTFRYQKHSAVGLSSRYRCDVFTGPVSGPKPPVDRRTNTYQGKYQKEIFACYRSHTMSTTGVAGIEKKADNRGSMFKSWKVRFAIVGFFLFPLFLWFAIHSFFAMGKGRKVDAPKVAAPAVVAPERSERATTNEAAHVVVAAEPTPAQVTESTRWRVQGEVGVRGSRFVILTSSVGFRKVRSEDCLLDVVGNWSCMIDGALATRWSGFRPEGPSMPIMASTVPTELTN